MGLYFGLFFSVNRERDGFNLMGFSQQLGSEQTGSKPGLPSSFLPLLHPQGTLGQLPARVRSGHSPPFPSSTPLWRRGALRTRNWVGQDQVKFTHHWPCIHRVLSWPGNSPLARKPGVASEARPAPCHTPLPSAVKEAESKNCTMNPLETLHFHPSDPHSSSTEASTACPQHLCAKWEKVTTWVVATL